MRRLCEIFLLMAVVFSGGFPGAVAAPRLSMVETVHDAGDLPQGKALAHEFVIRNVGDDVLTCSIKPC